MGNMNNMDSVFDGAMNNDIEFDTIFDQEDSLVDIVEGFGNTTDPLDDFNLEAAEGTEESEVLDISVDEKEIGKESDADKFTTNAEEEYHNGEKGPKVDENSVENTIDKVVEGKDIDDILDDNEEDIMEEGCAKKEEAEVDLSTEEDEPTEACGVKKEEAEVDLGPEEDEPTEACGVKKEETEVTIDSIEEDIEKEAQSAEKDMQKDDPDCTVKEAGDTEVENVEKDEEESDEDLIDIAMGQEKNDSAEEKYAYDISDEDLIDIAMNND